MEGGNVLLHHGRPRLAALVSTPACGKVGSELRVHAASEGNLCGQRVGPVRKLSPTLFSPHGHLLEQGSTEPPKGLDPVRLQEECGQVHFARHCNPPLRQGLREPDQQPLQRRLRCVEQRPQVEHVPIERERRAQVGIATAAGEAVCIGQLWVHGDAQIHLQWSQQLLHHEVESFLATASDDSFCPVGG
eukprot:5673741-Lingulodinium_polyedra.AAC.1